ncbi:MAG: phosphotransferase [Anaerolineales bacterium]|nr:phosphotransferase [Anaerolineales bacterium]
MPPSGPLPADFVQRTLDLHGQAGRVWLAQLPQLVAACAARWGLTPRPPFALSYNYVAPATLADGTPCVLKLRAPHAGPWTELAALRHYAGRGCAAVLAADDALGALLIEQLRPGAPLTTLPDDEATGVAAALMTRLWRPPPPDHPFPTLADWMRGLARLRAHYGGPGPFPAALLARAEGLWADLRSEPTPSVVLHGDLHHANILAAERVPWLAIDPQGVVGDPAFEAGALLRNPLAAVRAWPDLAARTARRLAILAERTGLDRRRLAGWALVSGVLSAWWTVEDHGRFRAAELRLPEALVSLS